MVYKVRTFILNTWCPIKFHWNPAWLEIIEKWYKHCTSHYYNYPKCIIYTKLTLLKEPSHSLSGVHQKLHRRVISIYFKNLLEGTQLHMQWEAWTDYRYSLFLNLSRRIDLLNTKLKCSLSQSTLHVLHNIPTVVFVQHPVLNARVWF